MSKESLEDLRERLLRDEHAQQLIRMRAFEIYRLRGEQPGGEAHDWFQAETEVITFLIEEESSRPSDSQSGAPREPESRASSPTSQGATKRAAPKVVSARKATAESSEKPPPAKRASKKAADSATKPRGKTKKDK